MTLDTAQRVSTAFVTLLVAVSVVAGLSLGSRAGVGPFGGVVLGFSLIALGLAWAMSPCELVVDSGEVRIERRAWTPLRIPLASIASASPMTPLSRRTIRVFGSGGFFGSYGLFWNDTLGRFRLYATHSRQAMLLRRTGNELPVVITPDDIVGAIAAIDRRPEEA